MIKVDQFFYGRHRLGRIACGVLIHDLELAAIDAAVSIRVFVQSDSPIVYGVSPQAGGTGQGAEHANLYGCRCNAGGVRGLRRTYRNEEDRKSTRLNSSH